MFLYRVHHGTQYVLQRQRAHANRISVRRRVSVEHRLEVRLGQQVSPRVIVYMLILLRSTSFRSRQRTCKESIFHGARLQQSHHRRYWPVDVFPWSTCWPRSSRRVRSPQLYFAARVNEPPRPSTTQRSCERWQRHINRAPKRNVILSCIRAYTPRLWAERLYSGRLAGIYCPLNIQYIPCIRILRKSVVTLNQWKPKKRKPGSSLYLKVHRMVNFIIQSSNKRPYNK